MNTHVKMLPTAEYSCSNVVMTPEYSCSNEVMTPEYSRSNEVMTSWVDMGSEHKVHSWTHLGSDCGIYEAPNTPRCVCAHVVRFLIDMMRPWSLKSMLNAAVHHSSPTPRLMSERIKHKSPWTCSLKKTKLFSFWRSKPSRHLGHSQVHVRTPDWTEDCGVLFIYLQLTAAVWFKRNLHANKLKSINLRSSGCEVGSKCPGQLAPCLVYLIKWKHRVRLNLFVRDLFESWFIWNWRWGAAAGGWGVLDVRRKRFERSVDGFNPALVP